MNLYIYVHFQNNKLTELMNSGGGGLPYETDGDARRKFWI